MQKVERKDGMSLAGGRFPRRVRKAFTRMNDRSGRAIEDVEAKLIADPTISRLIPLKRSKTFFSESHGFRRRFCGFPETMGRFYNSESIEFAKTLTPSSFVFSTK